MHYLTNNLGVNGTMFNTHSTVLLSYSSSFARWRSRYVSCRSSSIACSSMVRRLQCAWRLSIRHPLHSRRWRGSSSCWVYLRMILHPSGLYPQRGSSLMTLTKTWWPRCLNLFLKSRAFARTLNAGWRNWRINQWCTHRWSYEYEDKHVWAVSGQMTQYNMKHLTFPKAL